MKGNDTLDPVIAEKLRNWVLENIYDSVMKLDRFQEHMEVYILLILWKETRKNLQFVEFPCPQSLTMQFLSNHFQWCLQPPNYYAIRLLHGFCQKSSDASHGQKAAAAWPR